MVREVVVKLACIYICVCAHVDKTADSKHSKYVTCNCKINVDLGNGLLIIFLAGKNIYN